MCSQINLTSASATTITQPQTSAQSSLICSHHTRTGIRSDLFTRPTAATSSLQSPVQPPALSHEVLLTYSQHTAKEIRAFFLSLCLVSVKGWGEAEERCTKVVHQMCQKEIRTMLLFFFHFFTTLSLSATHSYSHKHTL